MLYRSDLSHMPKLRLFIAKYNAVLEMFDKYLHG